MGWFRNKKSDDGEAVSGSPSRLRGTAQVVSASRAPHHAAYGNIAMDLVVQVAGVEPYAHDYSKLITPTSKWPSPGMTLPVEVDADDLTDVEVLWDEMPSNAERGELAADQLAAVLRAFPDAQVSSGGMPGGAMPPPVVGTAGVTVVANQSGADPIERLAKLGKLRDAGIIDEAQFQQLRQQILDQAGIE